MPTYYDSKGNAHVLAEEIGRGGEGTVYFCEEKTDLVAKIYYESITQEKAEKLLWMAANKNESLLKVSAWVIDILYNDESQENVVGFLMPNVRAKEIHELYSLKSRRVYFPEATWHFLVHTAANVARAFYNLHRDDHVMGDVNHGNCVVLADGTVKLIDCDSYSIKTDKLRYICEVGVGTHLAPELQGKNLRNVERERKHDNFGLAVIIFQLLFLGRHPFSGNYLGEKDKTLEDCIRECRFAYGENTEFTNVKQPPGTLSLSQIPLRLAAMFERAFLTEDRPKPREWIEALEDLSNDLEQCTLHPGHHFYQELKDCPWCEIESQTGLMLFPFITSASNQNGEKPFNIFTIESLIANLGISQNLPALPVKPDVLPPPSTEVVETQKAFRNNQILIVVAQFVAVIFLMAIFGAGLGFFFGVVLMTIFIAYLNNYDKSVSEGITDHFAYTLEKWENLKEQWDQAKFPPKLDADLAQIQKKIGDYKKIQRSAKQELKLLQKENSRRLFAKYLRSHRLADTKIPGIKEEQRQELIQKGVRTAAEIEEKRLQYFHNVNDYLISRLLSWREDLEQNFNSEKDTGIPETEKNEVLQKIAAKRRIIEKEIEILIGSLRSGSLFVKNKQQTFVAKSEKLAKELVQAESDLNVVSNNSLASIALVLITIFTPFFGFVAGDELNQSKSITSSSTYNDSYSSTSGGNYGSGSRDVVYETDSYDDVPDENITDEGIADLTENTRQMYANNLYDQAINLISDGDKYDNCKECYDEAEKKLRLAIRLKKDQVYVLNQLGYVLYKQKKYDESLKYLNKALQIADGDYGTEFEIGINYLQTKRYKEARRLFIKLNAENSTLQGQFNLGLAHKGLKDYDSAAQSFSQAIKIFPDDADSHYELGSALYKKGDKDGAYGQYYILHKLDGVLAGKLKEEAKLFGSGKPEADGIYTYPANK
jgi:DNA-binding helix-hairpin-helix protein with protein kinase domain